MKAAELIPGIRAAYAALMKAETERFGETLFLAIELGTLLNQAKADPDVGAHGKWEKWFNEQNFGFSLRKAQRCMRYADKKDELMKATKTSALTHLVADHRLGICDADALLRKPKQSGSGSGSSGAKSGGKGSPDLAKLLPDTAADELWKAMSDCKWEKEKQKELLKQQLKQQNAYNVGDLLAEVWDVEELKRLGDQITDYLKLKAEPASPPFRPRPVQAEART